MSILNCATDFYSIVKRSTRFLFEMVLIIRRLKYCLNMYIMYIRLVYVVYELGRPGQTGTYSGPE